MWPGAGLLVRGLERETRSGLSKAGAAATMGLHALLVWR